MLLGQIMNLNIPGKMVLFSHYSTPQSYKDPSIILVIYDQPNEPYEALLTAFYFWADSILIIKTQVYLIWHHEIKIDIE